MMTFITKRIKDFFIYNTTVKYLNKNNILNLLCVFIFIACPSATNAHQYKLGNLEIIDPWTRTTAKNAKVGSGYLYIINHSDTPDQLIAISTNRAKETEIHSMSVTNNIMQMKKIPNGIEIPGKGEIILKPGGNHIMFIGLSKPFQHNEKINAKLIFEKAGIIEVDFLAKTTGATFPSK
ncbi:copper chaperone PCu(A)C [Bartonella sp. Raccoon60]|uniref:copper chaperone PCu(A)C n=1 Tax=Bartonella sp. Raccoon60 TaxID=1933912 RepID=UPI000998EB5E